jgi:RND family efflux transporter MFP subunit
MQHQRNFATATLAMLFSLALANGSVSAADSNWIVDGFTIPYRTVEIAAAEMGIVASIDVVEGETVKLGQILATLDQAHYRAQLAVAKKQMEASGPIEAAKAELSLRRERLASLSQLHDRGFARIEEIARAEADVYLGEADLQAETEHHAIRKLEYERIRVQMQRRVVRARNAGVVTAIHKHQGEFVAPNDPVIVTMVQLDPIYLPLSVPQEKLELFELNQKVQIRFAISNTTAKATVDFISPETHAESGTVMIRLRIANSKGEYRSGQRCLLDIDDLTGK